MPNNFLVLVGRDNPDSWDPLDFDKSNNIVLGRLTYSTPIEVNFDGSLTSSVLSSFEISDDQKEVSFTLKENLFFEDGTLIKIEDIKLAILRMALVRPKFPVISDILGIEQWAQEGQPLITQPYGLQIIRNTLKIRFSRAQRNPLFRFSLELFSIIPSTCIDKKSNKLTCERPPGSGRYTFVNDSREVDGTRAIRFQLRQKSIDQNFPEEINLVYKKNHDSILNLMNSDSKVVVSTSGILISKKDPLANHAKAHIQLTARSWFSVLRFNKKSRVFSDLKTRKEFADTFSHYLDMYSSDAFFIPERSIFTEIMPGYSKFVLNPPPRRKFHSEKIKFNSSVAGDENFKKAFEGTCDHLGYECYDVGSSSNLKDISINRTGFWAMDPLGDLKMLFTPHLHEILRDQWEDSHLIELVEAAYTSVSKEDQDKNSRLVNEYLFQESFFNTMAHYQQIYISNWKPERPAASQALTMPYPWHLF